MFQGIDLTSDTVTKPTPAMRKVMAEAEVGDEQKGEDPTTLKLEEKVAELLGLEQAMFFPSATMANEVAIRTHCEPGDEVIAASTAHVLYAEAGGPAIHSAVITRPIPTETGIFDGKDVQQHYRGIEGPHFPRTALVSVENTTNVGGGLAWPQEKLDSVAAAAKDLNLKTHLDGSRLLNAVIRTGTPAKRLASHFNTVTICLSKGLGCPVGALLAFETRHFTKVRRLKQLMGGAMRQSGILAAAGLYAFEHHIERLREDHENAERLAKRMTEEISDIAVETHPLSTNMVFFHWKGARISPKQFLDECLRRGLRFSYFGGTRFRAVTHLGIERSDIDRAVEILRQISP